MDKKQLWNSIITKHCSPKDCRRNFKLVAEVGENRTSVPWLLLTGLIVAGFLVKIALL